MGLKILLVDDEQEFVETLSERLQMRDMDAHAVFDGKTALARVDAHPPQVLIIDLKMPGMDAIHPGDRSDRTRVGAGPENLHETGGLCLFSKACRHRPAECRHPEQS
jgi:hypothetical protein